MALSRTRFGTAGLASRARRCRRGSSAGPIRLRCRGGSVKRAVVCVVAQEEGELGERGMHEWEGSMPEEGWRSSCFVESG